MPAYHQMGHDSENLQTETALEKYAGAILSPVNYNEDEVKEQINKWKSEKFEAIFDPQIYYPKNALGELSKWSYFPSDVETADHSSEAWWMGRVNDLSETVIRTGPSAVCSPAVVPKVFSDNYYQLGRNVADELLSRIAPLGISVLQTVIARLPDLSAQYRAEQIASLVTESSCDRIFLILLSDTDPRREISETEEIIGAMRLIRLLEQSGVQVLVGFSSSDVVLWKTAGASACATGKFFNLRRFTPSRWEPPKGGGGQTSYWFEESMMAFLRESDLIRVQRSGLLSSNSMTNPYAEEILQSITSAPKTPWLRLSWRQYLYWFADFETRLSNSSVDPDNALENAEGVWEQLSRSRILMEERKNDSNWLRPWRRAIIEYWS